MGRFDSPLSSRTVDVSISIDRIREAAAVIDPVFLHSPQFVSEPLSERVGVTTVLKVETMNPIRTFKGRGTDFLLHRLGDGPQDLVCASAGNFGQGMAHACRKRGRQLTVFAARSANPLKVERMRALGAKVELQGDDFDEAKDAAKLHAVNGMGTWLKHSAPNTRVIAVCAESAPSMALSWKAGKPVAAPSATIADGIAVRVPIAEALGIMPGTVDDLMLVSDDEMLAAMRALFADAGLVVEPAAAAGVAAIAQRAKELTSKRVATVLTGGNLTEDQVRAWLY